MTGLSSLTRRPKDQSGVDVEEAYGWSKDRRDDSYGALRSVLHALRDRLTVEEASDLSAQFTEMSIYFEGWKPSKVLVKMKREEFLERVWSELDFDVRDDAETEQLVTTVLTALRHYVTDGEFEDIGSVVLPAFRADAQRQVRCPSTSADPLVALPQAPRTGGRSRNRRRGTYTGACCLRLGHHRCRDTSARIHRSHAPRCTHSLAG
jgi:uncharacterized protein (DUF2267 family)